MFDEQIRYRQAKNESLVRIYWNEWHAEDHINWKICKGIQAFAWHLQWVNDSGRQFNNYGQLKNRMS
jgi:hypothetical protein